MTDVQYHEFAEHYLNVIQNEVEKAQEEGSDIEAEYSVRIAGLRSIFFFFFSFSVSSSGNFMPPL